MMIPMRLKVFGEEPVGTKLSPEFVEKKSISTILHDYTGQVVDVLLSIDVIFLNKYILKKK